MSGDIFVPESSAADALVSPLHTITLVTSEGDTLLTTLTEGFELTASEWFTPVAAERSTLNAYLGMPADSEWRSCACNGTGDNANVQVRLIDLANPTNTVRPEIDGRYVGGLSIGFPMANMAEREQTLKRLGINSSIGVKEMEFTSPTGEVYVSAEVHFIGPDNVFLLGVKRPDMFVPVGKMNNGGDIGAAAYSARCVSNTDTLMKFYGDALGFEIRRDATFTVEGASGLRLPKGCSERFIQAFAPGSQSGYLVFLDHDKDRLASPAPTLGPPNQGMVMWTFEVADLAKVLTLAEAHGCRILQPPARQQSPFLPDATTMIVEDPDGFPLEFFSV